jgi:hypothetical protein
MESLAYVILRHDVGPIAASMVASAYISYVVLVDSYRAADLVLQYILLDTLCSGRSLKWDIALHHTAAYWIWVTYNDNSMPLLAMEFMTPFLQALRLTRIKMVQAVLATVVLALWVPLRLALPLSVLMRAKDDFYAIALLVALNLYWFFVICWKVLRASGYGSV